MQLSPGGCLLPATGATLPFPSVPAKVALPNRQAPFSPAGGNWSSCPVADIEVMAANRASVDLLDRWCLKTL
jgi:hypothetical protein